jgi:hypothetical protein
MMAVAVSWIQILAEELQFFFSSLCPEHLGPIHQQIQ